MVHSRLAPQHNISRHYGLIHTHTHTQTHTHTHNDMTLSLSLTHHDMTLSLSLSHTHTTRYDLIARGTPTERNSFVTREFQTLQHNTSQHYGMTHTHTRTHTTTGLSLSHTHHDKGLIHDSRVYDSSTQYLLTLLIAPAAMVGCCSSASKNLSGDVRYVFALLNVCLNTVMCVSVWGGM